jgi:hypothetical protein
MASFPGSAVELTTDFLSEALSTTVRSFSLDDIGAGVGIFGEIVRVTLDADSGPATVIAKFPTKEPANLGVGIALGIYEREARFLPRCCANRTRAGSALLLRRSRSLRESVRADPRRPRRIPDG